MRYCRWSSDDFKSDLYIYEHIDGTWTIHVAGRRHVHNPPPTYEYPERHKRYVNAKRTAFTLTREGVEAWREWEDKNNPLVDIDLPHAGETFKLPSPGECADQAELLREIGFHVPQYALDALRADENEAAASVASPLATAQSAGADDASNRKGSIR